MLSKTFEHTAITGIACALPTKRVYTDEYAGYFGREAVDRFKESTGIRSRYLSNGRQTASDLCYVAAREIMKHKNLTGEDIDALVFFTQKPDYKLPSTAFVLHKRLGIKQECMVFDVNLGCSAFVNGVYMLASMICGGAINRALLLIGDASLEHPVYEDKSFTMMFGDAGSAVLIENGKGKIRAGIRSDGSGYRALFQPAPGARFPHGNPNLGRDGLENQMNGDDVFLFTITKVPKLLKEFCKENNCGMEDYDYCILHQANKMILDNLAKRLKLNPEKMPVSLGEYGNTDGSSIPLGIADLVSKNHVKEKLNLICSGFGIGLSWGVADFCISRSDVLPPVFTDEYFEEGFEL